MQLGKIIKELICTIKESTLISAKIFMVQLLKPSGETINDYAVAVDSGLSLGKGDIVLLVQGSSSRLLSGNKTMPLDCAISAKVDSVYIDSKYINEKR